ncbi:MAG: FtsX-like permease family protein [Bacteroidales bacterium]|nr:FtsX-like permease family protein [Bacteroidales bacterium]
MRLIQVSLENIKIALNSMRSNLLRTSLTVLIIAIGIMALVGILTAVDAIKNTISTQFTNMGAGSFTIVKKRTVIHGAKADRRQTASKNITYPEANKFKSSYNFPARVSIYATATGSATVISEYEKTNPNISIIGADEEYFQNSGYEIGMGRNFTSSEVYSGSHVVILGSALARTLFKSNISPIGSFVSIGSGKYLVIGVTNEKGTSMGGGGDNFCILPINNVRQYFTSYPLSFVISVQPFETADLDLAISEAEGVFRSVRKLGVYDDEDFMINKSDNLANMLFENIAVVTIGATLIGLITLIGATIGLMNIMLVSVSERTREIGIRKAIGAPSTTIKQQFLFESIVIGQVGGVFGIILGIIAGNLVTKLTGGSFIIPWMWIGLGVLLCLVVGVVSGYLPAIKASKLDPIVALHNE